MSAGVMAVKLTAYSVYTGDSVLRYLHVLVGTIVFTLYRHYYYIFSFKPAIFHHGIFNCYIVLVCNWSKQIPQTPEDFLEPPWVVARKFI